MNKNNFPSKHTDLWDGTTNNVSAHISVSGAVSGSWFGPGDPPKRFSITLLSFQNGNPILFKEKILVGENEIEQEVNALKDIVSLAFRNQITPIVNNPNK